MGLYKQLLFFILVVTACKTNPTIMKTPNGADQKFQEFIAKKKFEAEDYYPGIADEKYRPIFTEKINQVAADFQQLAASDRPTEKEYQKLIGSGLSRFSEVDLMLDTEDRERVCLYFEELMDIVGLKSSEGQLNNFMYGFDVDGLLKDQ